MNRYPLDDATADRLLSGAVSPEDAPPGCAGLAAAIRTALGPAQAGELAGQMAVVTAAAAAVHSAPTPHRTLRRNRMLPKLLSAKVAAVAAAATLGAAGVAAAATGHLPSNAQSAVSGAASHMGLVIPKPGGSGSSTATGTSHHSTKGKTDHDDKAGKHKSSGHGPNDDNANFGQCQAFLSGSATGRSHKDHSTAFADLIADHGRSVSSTTAYCKKVVAAHHEDTNATEKGDDSDKQGDSETGSHPGNQGAHSDETGHGNSRGSSTDAPNMTSHAPAAPHHT